MTTVLVDCVKACGGSARVGPLLWPELAPKAAQRRLLDCLNDERPTHNLTPAQVLFILRMARDKGYHGGMEFLCRELSYDVPKPIAPKDEADQLLRTFVVAMADLKALAERLERVAPVAGR